MSKLENFNSPEKEVLLEVFEKMPMILRKSDRVR
jgi:hypothetical protein